MNDLIGYDFAKENGFTVHSFSGDKTVAWYVDDQGIFLECFETEYDKNELNYKLSATHRMISLSLGPFTIPNKNYPLFYRQMHHALIKLNMDF